MFGTTTGLGSRTTLPDAQKASSKRARIDARAQVQAVTVAVSAQRDAPLVESSSVHKQPPGTTELQVDNLQGKAKKKKKKRKRVRLTKPKERVQ